MKKVSFKTCVALFGLSCVLSACNQTSSLIEYSKDTYAAFDDGEITYVNETTDTYYNYIELYDDKGVIYQIGDPFVTRYNGKYYLYSSKTGNSLNRGIPCWESTNMIDWEFKSWVIGSTKSVTDEKTYNAYAPEIVYFNGYYYLCEAPNGKGHYIYRSKTPYDPFELVSDNLGLGIDGHFYVENDSLYLLSAVSGSSANGYIYYSKLNVTGSKVTAGSKKGLKSLNTNGWTEGPGHFFRNGYKYLTYTGNHVNGAGYRIAYSYTTNDSLFEDLKEVDNNIIMITTGDDNTYEKVKGYGSDSTYVTLNSYRGTGHSSNVLGPNLDSEYLAYHNAGRNDHTGATSTSPGFNRRYNVTQLYTDGCRLSTNGTCTYDTPKPTGPDYDSNQNALVSDNGFKLTTESTENLYTAEVNLILNDKKGTCVFGFVDENNYSSFEINNTSIEVNKYQNGNKTNLYRGTCPLSDNSEAYHTIRVINGYGKSQIIYNDNKYIDLDIPFSSGGKVGVSSENGAGTIQFSNDAFGTADFESIKNVNNDFPAYTYLKEENRGFKLSNGEIKVDGVRQGEKESTKLLETGETAVKLNKGDWVKYALNVEKEGEYFINLKVSKDSLNKIVEAVVDESDKQPLYIKDASFSNDGYVFVNTGKVRLTAGIHSLKLRAYDGEVTFSRVEINVDNKVSTISNILTESFADANYVKGRPYVTTTGLKTTSDDHNVIYFGNKAAGNFEYTMDVKIYGTNAGFIFKASNYSDERDLNCCQQSLQCYYLYLDSSLGNICLWKYNYGQQDLYTSSPTEEVGSIKKNTLYTVKIQMIQNNIKIYLNNYLQIDCVDMNVLTKGYAGIFTDCSIAAFTNLEYKVC